MKLLAGLNLFKDVFAVDDFLPGVFIQGDGDQARRPFHDLLQGRLADRFRIGKPYVNQQIVPALYVFDYVASDELAGFIALNIPHNFIFIYFTFIHSLLKLFFHFRFYVRRVHRLVRIDGCLYNYRSVGFQGLL